MDPGRAATAYPHNSSDADGSSAGVSDNSTTTSGNPAMRVSGHNYQNDHPHNNSQASYGTIINSNSSSSSTCSHANHPRSSYGSTASSNNSTVSNNSRHSDLFYAHDTQNGHCAPAPHNFNGGYSQANNQRYDAAAQRTAPTLKYPADFFNEVTGIGAKTEPEAARLWQYRKNRPAEGEKETEQANGTAMLKEVQDMRARLKSHVETSFMDGARAMAKEWGLVDAQNRSPTTKRDLIGCLCSLERVEGSLANETIVYMVCHHFHRQKQWLAGVVDTWLRKENMEIQFPQKKAPKDGKSPRGNQYNRGGFGACARGFKSDIVKGFLRSMLTNAKWCVSTKNNKQQWCEPKVGQPHTKPRNRGDRVKIYEEITIHLKVVNEKLKAYVVTEVASDGYTKPAAKALISGTSTSNKADMIGLGQHILDTLGQSISPEQLQAIISNYTAKPDPVGLEIPGGVVRGDEEDDSLTSVSEFNNSVAHASNRKVARSSNGGYTVGSIFDETLYETNMSEPSKTALGTLADEAHKMFHQPTNGTHTHDGSTAPVHAAASTTAAQEPFHQQPETDPQQRRHCATSINNKSVAQKPAPASSTAAPLRRQPAPPLPRTQHRDDSLTLSPVSPPAWQVALVTLPNNTAAAASQQQPTIPKMPIAVQQEPASGTVAPLIHNQQPPTILPQKPAQVAGRDVPASYPRHFSVPPACNKQLTPAFLQSFYNRFPPEPHYYQSG